MSVYEGISAPKYHSLGSLRRLPKPDRVLFEAVQQQDLAAVQQQLAVGANPSAADPQKLTPLHVAVLTANGPVVGALLAAGADVSATSVFWHCNATPLQYLVMQGCRRCAGPHMIHASVGPVAPLHHCTDWCEQLAGVVQQLVAAGAQTEPVSPIECDHLMPLHYAAHAGCTTLVAALLQAGADPGTTTPKGYTVLHAAAVSGRREVVQQVLDALGSSRAAGLVNTFGQLQGKRVATPLHVAAQLGHLEVAEALIKGGAHECKDDDGVDPLASALGAGQCHLVPLLVSPTSVNERYIFASGGNVIEDITPLHYAALSPAPMWMEAYPEGTQRMVAAAVRAVEVLLEAGADARAKTHLGRTPLAEAVMSSHPAVLQVLVRHELKQHLEQLEQQQQQQTQQKRQKPSAASVLQEVGVKALLKGDGSTWQVLMSEAAEVLGEQGVHSLWGTFKQQLQEEVQQQQQQAVKALDAWICCWAAGAGQLATQRSQLTGRLTQLVVQSCQQQQQQAGACAGPDRPSKRPRLARELHLLGVTPAAAAAAGGPHTWCENSSGTSGGSSSSRMARAGARARDMVARAAAVQSGAPASHWGAYRSSTVPADALRDLEAAATSGSVQEVQAVLQQMPDRAAGLAAAAVTAAAVGRKRNWGLCMGLLRELVMLDEAKGRAAVHQVQLQAYAGSRWRNQGQKADGLVVPPKQSRDAPEPPADVAGELAAALQVCDALLADWLAVRQQRVRELRGAVVAAAGVAAAAPAACL